ncbi:hypothetical protein SISSUDRAFT_1029120 [Sistotremastrum suecicum HHB10207 ss-3]|uniref:C2 domain-containing protein n=1 Tax=Sistotremastrum suecicum HHB10207 ss-3 TaxID=1314776 RepID=A0A166J6S5_9AGAM|nr:hypothetical protein SISSUDRAFT_1029120 [Sistotremastrum suecicum HHB10207 ss-3]
MSDSETFVVEITFHRGSNLPVADLNTLSCDPYIHATVWVPSEPEHEHPLAWRTPTVRRTRNPTWDCKWRIAGVPRSGFHLTLRVRDEDPGDRDDRLGKSYIDMTQGQMKEGFEQKEFEVKVMKRKGSFRPYIQTYLTAILPGSKLVLHPRIVLSVRVIAKSPKGRVGRAYTVGPNKFSEHFSPMIGRMVKGGTVGQGTDGSAKLSMSTFVAHKFQLSGPVPPTLKHEYVGYAPFIKSMFSNKGIRGHVLNHGLHKQYRIIYSYDKNTVYGVVPGTTEAVLDEEKEKSVRQEMAEQFLRMTCYGEEGRIFTYVITLDAEWRFTETGKEFAVDLLSKHSMHADVAKEIAFSGEFFVQKIRDAESGGERDTDPRSYELVIDNDSGTYRPKKELLPTLQDWLSGDGGLGGLGKVTAMDGFDEHLKQMKEEKRNLKARLKAEKAGRRTDRQSESASS